MTDALEMTLTEAVRQLDAETKSLANLRDTFKIVEAAALKTIAALERRLKMDEMGIDTHKVLLAEHIVYVTEYSKGGEERDSARTDAIHWFATHGPERVPYHDLRSQYFGTKSYDRWHGQRSDHSYGMGPRHGSIIFRIELLPEPRKRTLTADEIEAAIYYLTNLERIQAAARSAKQ